MDAFKLEEKLQSLIQKVINLKSHRQKINTINPFLDDLLRLENAHDYKAFVLELLPHYVDAINSADYSGTDPEYVEGILDKIDKTIMIEGVLESLEEIVATRRFISEKLDEIKSIVDDNEGGGIEKGESEFLFPVLDKELRHNNSGHIDGIEIVIVKNDSSTKDNFFIIPTQYKNDSLLKQQMETSWKLTIEHLIEQGIKVKSKHDIVIKFSNHEAEYIGDSLGVAITIGFLEKAFRLYNSRNTLSLFPKTVSTGRIDSRGKILAVSDKLIELKTKSVFFSRNNNFIVPKDDEGAAKETNRALSEKYPKRKLTVTGVESIHDLLNRRNLINFHRQNIIVWASKNIAKNKLAIASLIPLFFLVTYFMLSKIDNNPSEIIRQADIINIHNQYGEFLWGKKLSFSSNNGNYTEIIDYNNDGENEVLICHEDISEFDDKSFFGRLALLNSKAETIWQFNFSDKVRTAEEIYEDYYKVSSIIGFTTFNERRVVIACAVHNNYWPSPIFMVDLKTGKRVGDIFWHPGSVYGGIVNDFDNDGKDEIIATAINNNFNCVSIFKIKPEHLKGTLHSTEKYTLLGMENSTVDDYILVPMTDYRKHFNSRYNVPDGSPSILQHENKIRFSIREDGPIDLNMAASYRITSDFSLTKFEIIIPSYFRVNRDRLITSGKLKGPLTDTFEYREILRNQIVKWDPKTNQIFQVNN